MVFACGVVAARNPMFSILDNQGGGRVGRSAGDDDHPTLSVVDARGGGEEDGAAGAVRAVFDLAYHGGALLSESSSMNVYIVWYGRFSSVARSAIVDFFASFGESAEGDASVSRWWKTTAAYKDNARRGVAGSVELRGEVDFGECRLGRRLSRWDLELLVVESLGWFPADPRGVVVVLTAEDVMVEGMCMNSCGSHSFLAPSAATGGQQVAYAWVGDAGKQCPGMCAWPLAGAEYGPAEFVPVVAPNGDVGADGMIMNIGSVLAGAATDPYMNGWYQGDVGAALEAGTACAGIYGEGAYPGYPGKLQEDAVSGASYNVRGVGERKYLLPALWDPVTRTDRKSVV